MPQHTPNLGMILCCLLCCGEALAQPEPTQTPPTTLPIQGPAPQPPTLATPGADTRGVLDKDWGPFWFRPDMALPYPLENVFRGFSNCRRGRHKHKALDIGGVGEQWGLGTPIRAITRARVIYIGTPETDPARYGARLTEPEMVERGKTMLPTSKEIPGYGKVWFFTQSHGRARTGVFVSLRATGGRLKGNTLNYMHLSALRPDLEVGTLVEAGEEIGLMGGTAVQSDAPHLHLAIKTRSGRALDIGQLFGIGSTRATCRSGKNGERAKRTAYTQKARKLMGKLRRKLEHATLQPDLTTSCGSMELDITAQEAGNMIWRILPEGADPTQIWTLRLVRQEGKWKPRLRLQDAWGKELFNGRRKAKSASGLKVKTLKRGHKGDTAALAIRVKPGTTLRVVADHWGKRSLPAGAHFKLQIERPCEAAQPTSP